MSSLFHGTPVKTLGDAIYDIPGLTEQGELDDFWECEREVDAEMFKAFRAYLVQRNQLNGNLYRKISDHGSSGIVWSDNLSSEHTWIRDKVENRRVPNLTVIEGGGINRSIGDNADDAEAA